MLQPWMIGAGLATFLLIVWTWEWLDRRRRRR